MNIEATPITLSEVIAMIPTDVLPLQERIDLVFGQIIIAALQRRYCIYLVAPLFTEVEFKHLETIMAGKGFEVTTLEYTDMMIYLTHSKYEKLSIESPIK